MNKFYIKIKKVNNFFFSNAQVRAPAVRAPLPHLHLLLRHPADQDLQDLLALSGGRQPHRGDAAWV